MTQYKEGTHEMTDDDDEYDEGLAELDRQAEKRRQSPKLIYTKLCGVEISTVWDDEDECYVTEDSESVSMEISSSMEEALSDHFKIACFILKEGSATH